MQEPAMQEPAMQEHTMQEHTMQEHTREERQLVPAQIRSHANSNDWNPLPGEGTDTISFTLPPNRNFTRYSVDLLTPPVLTGYEVISAPKPGATGQQRIRVKWYHAPFNKVSYRVHIYHGKRGPVEIIVDSPDWLNRVRDAIEQELEIRLIVRGIQARDLYRQILLLSPEDLFVPADLFYEPEPSGNGAVAEQEDAGTELDAPLAEPATATVTITMTVVVGLVVIAFFATIAGVLMMAMHKGYKVPNAKFKAKTHLGEFELEIPLYPS